MNASSCIDDRCAGERPAAFTSPDDHLAPVLTFDEQLPAGLAARFLAADSDQVLLRDFTRTLATALGVMLVLIGVVGSSTGVGDLRLDVTAGLVGLVVVLAGGLSQGMASRRPDGFTAREIDAVLDHQRWVSFHDWNQLTGDETGPEVLAARRAAGLATTLVACPFWSDAVFDTHRMRLDPTQESRRIQLAAREIFDERAAFRNAVAAEVDPLAELAALRADWAGQLDAAWATLTARLEAFARYTEEVLAVAAELDRAETARRLTLDLLAKGPGLATRTAEHELAAADLDRMRAELLTLRPESARLLELRTPTDS